MTKSSLGRYQKTIKTMDLLLSLWAIHPANLRAGCELKKIKNKGSTTIIVCNSSGKLRAGRKLKKK